MSIPESERVDLPADGARLDTESAASKRRHARPVELDSEGEEKEEETSGREGSSVSDREEEPDEETSERLSTNKVRKDVRQLT